MLSTQFKFGLEGCGAHAVFTGLSRSLVWDLRESTLRDLSPFNTMDFLNLNSNKDPATHQRVLI